jgi:peptide/nickel transport system permease protein
VESRRDLTGDRVTSTDAVYHRPAVAGLIARRLLLAVPVLFVISLLSFLLVSLTPGDAAQEILGQEAPPDAVERFRGAFGLDQPVYEQYWNWLTDALHGDFGESLYTREEVTDAIGDRIPVTISLIALTMIVSLVFGVGLGMFSAVRGGTMSRLLDSLSLVGFALPVFWVGLILISVFSVRLNWFPTVGYVPITESPREWAHALVLPVMALAIHFITVIGKQTREAMLDSLSSEYIRLARANGIRESSILFRHALKNTSIRVVTILGLLTVGLLGGTVFVETVFALPGVGGLAVTASTQHDLPVVQGIVIYFTLVVIVVNLAVDVAYGLLNPKVSVT